MSPLATLSTSVKVRTQPIPIYVMKIHLTNPGAYILSPLEESSRDPEQNAGFVVTWLCSNQESRVTSYSVRNSLDLSSSPPASPTLTRFNTTGKATGPTGRSRTRSNTLPALSNILQNNASFGTAGGITNGTGGVQRNFAAFKVLPIDPARVRRMSSYSSNASELATVSEEMQGASTCKEAVDLIVEKIQKACEDIGGGQGDFITSEDVVRYRFFAHRSNSFANIFLN